MNSNEHIIEETKNYLIGKTCEFCVCGMEALNDMYGCLIKEAFVPAGYICRDFVPNAEYERSIK